MSLERAILIIVWIVGTIVIALLVHRPDFRQFVMGFLVCQAITWVNEALHVKLHWVSYPVREFPKATELGFTMQYMVYPLLCGIYLICEPQRSWTARGLYLIAWCSGLAVFHYGLARYTRLIQYIHYHWYIVWIAFFIIFVLVNAIVRWFFKDAKSVQEVETAQ
ncbi:hypothetical protein ACVLD2_000514 [Paenibacillus sp. PvR052]|nr:hypothetical protein [Paenibacillus sp. PvP091]MBP1169042.1 hypothetical protein [Paenibacillus sp. PvR098]MBP2440070.1 hypothetical protein [Paenibacillus sp. PvP052]